MKTVRLSLWEYVLFCKGHPLLLLICPILIFGLIGLWQFVYLRATTFYHVSLFSLADMLILVASPPIYMIIGIAIVPIMLVVLVKATENDRLTNNVVRLQNLSDVWVRQLVKSFCVAFTIAIPMIAATLIAGSLRADSLINFGEQRSLFAFVNEGQVMPDLAFSQVLATFCVYCLLILLAVALLWSTLDLLIAKHWLSFSIVMLLGLVEVAPAGIKGLYYYTGIGYQTWLSGASQRLWLLAVLIVGLGCLGAYLTQRRLVV